MRKIYLDSNIFVCVYSKERREKEKRMQVEKALNFLSTVDDVILCTSAWTITEVVKVLVKEKKLRLETVDRIQLSLREEKRILESKFEYIDIGGDPDYDFDEFFYQIREGLLSFKSHLADIMHSVIMKNNNVERILTFDGGDFTNIPELIVLNPEIMSKGIDLLIEEDDI